MRVNVTDDRLALAQRFRDYAERMDAGEMLEGVGLVDDLNDAAEELAAEEE